MTTIHEAVKEQTVECDGKFMSKLSYYKTVLRTVLASLTVTTALILTVIAATYQPIRDIAVLKSQVLEINAKLDFLIKKSHNEEAQKIENNLVNNTKGE